MGTFIGARRFSPPGVPRENDYSRWTMRQSDVILLNRTPAGALEDLPMFAEREYADV